MGIHINCDMGESFGLYRMGDDTGIMPFITQANVACGFHGSDPNHMRNTVELARKHGVKVGAHFALPDLAGFGRREMKMERQEMANIITYQVGALQAFLEQAGMQLSHLKPHGALYGMAMRLEHIAHAIADVAQHYKVPVFGLSGTLHEEIYTARGLEFYPEFYADLDYSSDGTLIITREHESIDPTIAAHRCLRAVQQGKATSIDDVDIDVQVSSICIHSDTPNAERGSQSSLCRLTRFHTSHTVARKPIMTTKTIVSPLPGIFYRKPSPEAAAYKEVGDQVDVGDVVGLVEVMKSFHEVKADISGTVIAFHIENEDAVMAGQAILAIEG